MKAQKIEQLKAAKKSIIDIYDAKCKNGTVEEGDFTKVMAEVAAIDAEIISLS